MAGIIISVLLGWCGGYQFYKGKTGMGILYLFTGGLFGIGWIIDIIKACGEYSQPKHFAPEPLPQININTRTSQDEETVSVLMPDGTTEELSINALVDETDYCLVCGGSKYHVHAGCFKKWDPAMRATFNGWEAITYEDALEQGYGFCKFCKQELDQYNSIIRPYLKR